MWHRIVFSEQDNEPSGSIKGGKFLDPLSGCYSFSRTLFPGIGPWVPHEAMLEMPRAVPNSGR
jgi:hypothetical protein